MYSARIIEHYIQQAADVLRIQLVHHPLDYYLSMRERLDRAWTASGLNRALTDEERAFIRNEQILCPLDFRYWAERYATIDLDPETGGGLGPLKLWHAQEVVLGILAKAEESQWDARQRGETNDGLRLVLHKARQLGATMLARCLILHRQTLHPNTRSMSASVDDDKIMELYRRDRLIYDRLPFYLQPEVEFDVKAEHISFGRLNSHLLYQASSQRSGLGQGRQFHVAHLTECASWEYPLMIEQDFFGTLPRAHSTLCVLESTANGRGNWWHEFTEQVRRRERHGWLYCFVPWYAEPGKYRRTPSANWKPSEVAILHAKKVHETSSEWTGRPVYLHPEQLYWWETERESYRRSGTLNLFLTNWCATPEESFQHSGRSMFDTELLERLRLKSVWPYPYEVEPIADAA